MFTKKVQYSALHLEMIKRVVNFALSAGNLIITNSSVPFKAAITFIQGKANAIDVLWAEKDTVITGYAAEKRAAKDSLVEIMWSIMHPSLAFAINTGNENLRAGMDFSKSKLRKMSYANIVSRATISYELLQPYFTTLAAYNITSDMTNEWMFAKDTLANLLSAPKMAINNRKSINNDIQTQLRETLTYMRDVMDPMAVLFSGDEPAYYSNYLNNRMLQPRTNHTKFRVTVRDDAGNPIAMVKVQQAGTENMGLTDLNGECTLHLEIDPVNYRADKKNIYSFTLTADTLSTTINNVKIAKGKSTTRKVTMQTTGFVVPAVNEKTKATA